MEISYFLVLFSLGVLIQSIFLLRKVFLSDTDALKYYPLCFLIGLIGFWPGKNEYNYDLNFHYLLSVCLFIGSFGWFYKDKILSKINEQVLLQLSIIVFYALAISFGVTSVLTLILALVMVIALVLLVYVSLIETTLSFGWKVLFYAWYLAQNVILIVAYLGLGNIWKIFNNEAVMPLSSWDSVIFGMSFFYLVINVFYIYELIPIPGKHQSMEDRMRQWREYATLLTLEYQDAKTGSIHTLIIISLQGGVLILNYFFRFMSPFVLISLSVASTQVLSEIFSRYNTSQPQLVTDNSHPPKKETGVVDDGVIVDTTLTNLETSQEPPNNS